MKNAINLNQEKVSTIYSYLFPKQSENTYAGKFTKENIPKSQLVYYKIINRIYFQRILKS